MSEEGLSPRGYFGDGALNPNPAPITSWMGPPARQHKHWPQFHPRRIAKRETREADLTGTHRRVGHPPECKGPAVRRSTRLAKPAILPRAKRRPRHLHPAGRQSTGHGRAEGPEVLQRGCCGLRRFRPRCRSLAYGRTTGIISRSADSRSVRRRHSALARPSGSRRRQRYGSSLAAMPAPPSVGTFRECIPISGKTA